MRYLRQKVLNPKTPQDNSVSVNIAGEIILNKPYHLVLPKGVTAQRSADNSTFVNGMIRYNSTTNEFEGYQSGAWRNFRFKEASGVILQTLATGDGVETTFGPLLPDPFTYSAQSGVTWDATQMAKNLVVLVENVSQIGTVNFTVVQNPVGYDPGTYLVFSSPVPVAKPVYVFHKFDQ